MIYLAIPYSGIEELSFKISCMVTAFLMKTGKTVYSPIVHGHILATKYDLPADREFWLKHDLDILCRCDELYVVAMEGWDKSVGVLAEIREAQKLEIPIKFVDPGVFIEKLNQRSRRDLRPRSSRDIILEQRRRESRER
jgi:hypothetical protein